MLLHLGLLKFTEAAKKKKKKSKSKWVSTFSPFIVFFLLMEGFRFSLLLFHVLHFQEEKRIAGANRSSIHPSYWTLPFWGISRGWSSTVQRRVCTHYCMLYCVWWPILSIIAIRTDCLKNSQWKGSGYFLHLIIGCI